MSNNWQKFRLGDAPLEIIDGDRGKNYPSQSDFFDNEHCLFLNTKNVRPTGFDFSTCQFITEACDKLLRKGKLRRNDIVLTTRGTIGNIAFYDDNISFENVRINSGMVIIRPDETKLFPRFNYYLFKKLQDDFSVFTTGSAQPQLPIKDLIKLSVRIPPLPTQRAIAATLSCLDGKIELNNRINANLEAQAQAIFKSWFKNQSFEHWNYGELSDIATINPQRELKKGINSPYLEMSNLPTKSSFPTNWEERDFSGGMKFRNGDTVLARITPCLENGKTAYINFMKEDEIGFGSTEYIVLSAKDNYPNEMLYFLARTDDFRNYAIKNMTGTSGRQRVSGDMIGKYKMFIPPKEIITKYALFFKSCMSVIRQNSFESRALATIRDALLPKLMAGEIEVEEKIRKKLI